MRNLSDRKRGTAGRLRALAVLGMIILLLLTAIGCGKQDTPDPGQQAETQQVILSVEEESDDISESEAQPEEVIDEDGSYTSKDDVALYLHTYGKLPPNFITKNEAKKLGWQGGSLEDYAPGKCIGGDRFGNYEGVLPDEGSYHECDIDTLGASGRGPKRIVYSDDGRIYYTEDHYETFEQLY